MFRIKPKSIVLFAALAVFGTSMFAASAPVSAANLVDAPTYYWVNVDRDGWNFYYYQAKDIIIARSSTNIAVYGSPSTEGSGTNQIKHYGQRQDYYRSANIAYCESHIDMQYVSSSGGTAYNGGGNAVQTSSVKNYTLYENNWSPENATPAFQCFTDNWHPAFNVSTQTYGGGGNTVTITNPTGGDRYTKSKNLIVGTADANTIAAAAAMNFGEKPIGCDNFPGKPDKNLKYNCPEGGSIQNGKKVDATIEVAGATTAEDAPSCRKSFPGVGWIVCPIAEAADKFIVWVDNVLYKLLRVNDISGDTALKDGWRAFRNIASALIVLVALVMIASQIFSFDFMSAYTIKKILPRLFIAAIAIQLSWIIASVLVDFFNALGDSVEAIMYAPFPEVIKAASSDQSAITQILSIFAQNYSLDTGAALASTGILIGASVAGLFAVGFWGILFASITLVIVGLIAFVTLVLRKIVIIGLILIFPLAIAAWILPNTQKWWSNWWSLFSKLLLMYPLVIGLLTIGKIFAWMAATGAAGFESLGTAAIGWNLFAETSDQTGIAVFFIILVAYFGPYVFIPSMFKMAGGIWTKGIGMLEGQGGKLKNMGPAKRVDEARQNYKKGRDYNRKQTAIQNASSSSYIRRKYGQFQAGTMGATGAYEKQLRTVEEQEAIKNSRNELAAASKGQDYKAKMSDFTTLAGARVGTTVSVNGTSLRVTEAMQRTAAATLAENGEVDNLNLLRDRLWAQGDSGKAMWNTITDENAGNILKTDPMLLGKKVGDLNAEQLVTIKPQSLRRGRQALRVASATDQQNAIDRAREALSNTETMAKLSESAKIELDKISRGDFTSMTSEVIKAGNGATYTAAVDFAGRTSHKFDDNNTLYVNPEFGRSASAEAGQPGSASGPPKMF